MDERVWETLESERSEVGEQHFCNAHQYLLVCIRYATLAQLVERHFCKVDVVSSNLTGGSITLLLSVFTTVLARFIYHTYFLHFALAVR